MCFCACEKLEAVNTDYLLVLQVSEGMSAISSTIWKNDKNTVFYCPLQKINNTDYLFQHLKLW